MSEIGKLGSRLRALKNGHKVSFKDLTVLAPQNDPYRVDTPSGHRDARWFLKQLNRAIGDRETIHLRGLHYAIVAHGKIRKPNGQPYRNTDEDWAWLQGFPAKAARWLGYVPFDRIRDNRNDPPIIHRRMRRSLARTSRRAVWISSCPGRATSSQWSLLGMLKAGSPTIS